MKAVLDAGALVAVDKRDRYVGAMLQLLQVQGVPLHTSVVAVAQVWRDGRNQALLARVLAGVKGLDQNYLCNLAWDAVFKAANGDRWVDS